MTADLQIQKLSKVMKLREIFRFELACQLRRVSTWLYFAALVVVVLPFVRGNYIGNARSGGYLLNSPAIERRQLWN